ncbi:kinase-like domain-containing protein [Delphinella strobiligena]|nr:kinase-like domain-containing protein [Delphinella strobiligena]
MGTRSYAQVPPTTTTIAYNAFIFGYAGPSLVTPHAALKQLWWTDDRIETKVTRHFIVSQIRGEEREFLNKPLGFGEGLTDDSYMDWILARARRLFLILAEIGKSEQIFGMIDDSLDDDDLPFSLQTIRQLELSIEPDDRLDKKCYETQFLYLLRQLKQGSHIDYGLNEHIPMEYVHKLPPAVTLQYWDRVHFPNDPDRVFLRRKFDFGSDDLRDAKRSEYRSDIAKAKYLKHEHISPVWASYTTGDSGYVLSDFVPEHTLSSFIAQRLPYQFMRVPATERPILILEWLHCLSDALASLHHRGTYHGAIRPTNIVIDYDNRIAFADVGVLQTFQREKKIDKKEIAEYAAPEVYINLTMPRTNAMGEKTDSASNSSGSTRTTGTFFHAPHATNPEAADVFSLGCIFLDVLTWLVKGRLNEFHRFRSSPPPPGLLGPSNASIRSTRSAMSFLTYKSNATRSTFKTGNGGSGGERVDSAYAAQIAYGKLELWISELREESLSKLSDQKTRGEGVANEAVWVNGVPELLRLCKQMLAQEAEDRPSARAVRDDVERVLGVGCCIQSLCCRGREWEAGGEEGKRCESRRGARRSERSGGGMEKARDSASPGADTVAGAEDVSSTDGEGVERHARSHRVDEAIETKRSGGVPVTRRKINLPWRKK